MQAIGKILISSLAVLVAAFLLPGVEVRQIWIVVVVAVVLGVVNFFVRPVLIILTLPVTIITLGLFLLVLNAALVLLVDWLVPGFEVAGFWWALAFSLIVSLVSGFLNRLR